MTIKMRAPKEVKSFYLFFEYFLRKYFITISSGTVSQNIWIKHLNSFSQYCSNYSPVSNPGKVPIKSKTKVPVTYLTNMVFKSLFDLVLLMKLTAMLMSQKTSTKNSKVLRRLYFSVTVSYSLLDSLKV
jgi:hypothetical protein